MIEKLQKKLYHPFSVNLMQTREKLIEVHYELVLFFFQTSLENLFFHDCHFFSISKHAAQPFTFMFDLVNHLKWFILGFVWMQFVKVLW